MTLEPEAVAAQLEGDWTASVLELAGHAVRCPRPDVSYVLADRWWEFMRRGLEARGLSAEAIRRAVFTSRWSTESDEWVLSMEWPAGDLGGVMRATAREPRSAYTRPSGWWAWTTYHAGAKLLRSLG